jgi:ubiquinone/menaquinone biosynthesis C-methylase UbiE
MTTLENYPLGYSEAEARRLMEQGAMFEDLTRDYLSRAGLAPGMRVLDVGCGVGDVSLLAGGLVGRTGSVLGVDRSAPSLEIARARAKRRTELCGTANILFVEADLDTFEPDGTFDAIIGRFVLLYVPGRASMLRRLTQSLRRGGVMAMQEIDISSLAQRPSPRCSANSGDGSWMDLHRRGWSWTLARTSTRLFSKRAFPVRKWLAPSWFIVGPKQRATKRLRKSCTACCRLSSATALRLRRRLKSIRSQTGCARMQLPATL